MIHYHWATERSREGFSHWVCTSKLNVPSADLLRPNSKGGLCPHCCPFLLSKTKWLLPNCLSGVCTAFWAVPGWCAWNRTEKTRPEWCQEHPKNETIWRRELSCLERIPGAFCFSCMDTGEKKLCREHNSFRINWYCNYFGSSSKASGLDYDGQLWKHGIPPKGSSHKWSYSKIRQEPVQDVHIFGWLMAQHCFFGEIQALEPKLLIRLSGLHMCLIALLGWGPAELAPGMRGKQWHFALSIENFDCY